MPFEITATKPGRQQDASEPVVTRGLVCRANPNQLVEPLVVKLSAPRIRGIHQSHGHCHAFTISHNLNLDSLTNLMFVQHAEQVIGVADFVIVDADNDVTEHEITHLGLLHSS